MKTLIYKLNESLLDDEEELVNDDNTVLIEQFLKDNYEISGSYTIKNGVVDVIGKIKLSNKSLKHLTNNLFKFGTVKGKFICASSDITSLEGAPDQVEYFSCRRCNNLLSLKYSPKYVSDTFACSNCPKLKNLEGAPIEVNNFYCYDCASLSSLKGLPKKISGDLECNGCPKLKIKEVEKYLPNIGGDLYCDSDINKQLNYKDFNFKVGGDIYSN